MNILRSHHLCHRAGGQPNGRWLYQKMNAEFSTGWTALIGPNGSGKSTLLRQLAGLDEPMGGHITLGGQNIIALQALQRAKNLAYLPQQTQLYEDLTLEALVMLGRGSHLGRFTPPSHSDRTEVTCAMERVGLSHLCERPLSQMSGGEQQRAMLARMLVAQTPLLILDEPIAPLDIGHALDFMQLCQSLVDEGRVVIMAIHDLELARRYATQVLCLKNDGTHHVGATEDIMRPELLSDVFDVTVQRVSSGLVFHPQT